MAFAIVRLTSLLWMVLISPLFCQGTTNSEMEDLEVCETQVCQDSARFLLESMNASVDPCDDFYQYACGGWIEKHPIPKGSVSYSVTAALSDDLSTVLAGILKNATNENHPKAVIDASRLFQGCIDAGARERQGINPLLNVLNSIGGFPMIDPQWNNTSYKWYEQVAKLRRTLDLKAIIDVDIMDDDKGGHMIGLSQADFFIETEYLRNLTSKVGKKVIAYYKKYIITTVKLLNPNMDETSLRNAADEIIQFEAALAVELEPLPEEKEEEEEDEEDEETDNSLLEVFINFLGELITEVMSPAESEPESNFTIADLQNITENKYFEWTDFLNEILLDLPQVTEDTEVAVQSLAYLKHVIEVVQNTDSRIVANYIGWIFLKNFGHYTTKAFRDNAAGFLSIGQLEEVENLAETCVQQTTSVLDFAVGRLYVDKYIAEQDVRETEQLVEDVRSAFEVNFNHIDWMDSITREKALEKLRYMALFIGYPPWIKIDSELNEYYLSVNDIRQDEYFESFVRAKTAVEAIKLGKWDQPVHRTTEWPSGMSIVEVNAQYDPSRNAISLPAAIFNVPIYKRGTVPALNYAGFGSYIAHEITHGFDSEGHKYDKEGRKVDWWSEETKTKFEEKAECIKGQYSVIVEPMTNTSLREEETLPDDIADNGAARNAFLAYEMQVVQAEEHQTNRQNMRLPGLSATPEQLYFLALATMECVHHTKRSMKWTIENDDHSPAEYRVRVPLRNSRAFAEAYKCPVGSPMNPAKKCQLW